MRINNSVLETLLAKNYEVQNDKSCKASELAKVPADNSLSVLLEGSNSISPLFPVASNGRSGSTRVGADEIPRSNGAGDVGALWQVLTLLPTGKDAGVSSRCGCRPAGDALAALKIERKGPASVDSRDRTHGNPEGSYYVSDHNLVFSNLNPGKPKEHQGAQGNGKNQWNAQKSCPDPLRHQDAGKRQDQGSDYDNREESRGLSYENLHVTSVAVNEKGLCLNDL
jgi:hypothetical protein